MAVRSVSEPSGVGNAQGEAVELAFEVRQDQADGGGGSGRRRDDRQGGGARAAEVAVRRVVDALIRRVAVDRRHEALLDAERVVQDLGHRREAVGGARGVRDDRFGSRQHIVVDAEHDGRVDLALGRSRDDDFLGARCEVQVGAFAVAEHARRLDHDLAAQLAPRQFGRVALGEDRKAVAVDDQGVAVDFDGSGETAVDRVVLEQVGERRRVGQVVDADDVEVVVFAFEDGAKDEPSDAAKAVDTEFDSHERSEGERLESANAQKDVTDGAGGDVSDRKRSHSA